MATHQQSICSIIISWQQWIKDCGPLREPTSDWFKRLIGLKINYNFGGTVTYRLKSEFALLQTFLRLFHLVYFVKYWQMLLELNSKGLYQSSGKEKEICCLVFPSSTKREFNHFHFVFAQRRQRNVQKEWCTWKVVVLLIKTYLFFAVLVAVEVIVA